MTRRRRTAGSLAERSRPEPSTVTESTRCVSGRCEAAVPGKIYLNVWNGGAFLHGWAGPFQYPGPRGTGTACREGHALDPCDDRLPRVPTGERGTGTGGLAIKPLRPEGV